MVLEGPRSIRAQEEEHRREKARILTVEEEELALLCDRKSLKSILAMYRQLRGPPGKRQRTPEGALG